MAPVAALFPGVPYFVFKSFSKLRRNWSSSVFMKNTQNRVLSLACGHSLCKIGVIYSVLPASFGVRTMQRMIMTDTSAKVSRIKY